MVAGIIIDILPIKEVDYSHVVVQTVPKKEVNTRRVVVVI